MNDDTIKKISFFVLNFILFIVACKMTEFYIRKNPNSTMAVLGISALGTAVMVGLYFALLNSKENLGSFQTPLSYSCRGGPYMNQGNSPHAVACRQYIKDNPNQFRGCRAGQIGQPTPYDKQFRYYPQSFGGTPEYPSNWSNLRSEANRMDPQWAMRYYQQ